MYDVEFFLVVLLRLYKVCWDACTEFCISVPEVADYCCTDFSWTSDQFMTSNGC